MLIARTDVAAAPESVSKCQVECHEGTIESVAAADVPAVAVAVAADTGMSHTLSHTI